MQVVSLSTFFWFPLLRNSSLLFERVYAPKETIGGSRSFSEVVADCGQIVSMMMAYLQFHGGRDEDMVAFLENLELACISTIT